MDGALSGAGGRFDRKRGPGSAHPAGPSGSLSEPFFAAPESRSSGPAAVDLYSFPGAWRALFSSPSAAHGFSALRHGPDRIGRGEKGHLVVFYGIEEDEDLHDREGSETDGIPSGASLQRNSAIPFAGPGGGKDPYRAGRDGIRQGKVW